ncbi:PAS domain-containing protein [Pelagibaculum spongiae]|uniref:PAS domain-containing protein n=1 Tax=Pelagibaculum spongiae TaxID=2080658 RepID=A0A2V1H0M9_9GAMM|nr:PAS domain-containing protein [Pelagibaculum spongiae]PVZ69562.1 hypothetical protein DC094_09595 [Pelagibaculum spongiae]
MGFKQYIDKLRQGDTSLLLAPPASPSFQWQLVINRQGVALEAPRSLAVRMGKETLTGEPIWFWPCWYEKGWEISFLKEALDDALLGIKVRRAGLRARLDTGEGWWEVSLSPVDNNQDETEFLLLEVHDQTQVFRLRQQAGKMLDRQRQLVEGIQDALLLVDETGHILQANRFAERLFTQQVSGNQLKTLIPELQQMTGNGFEDGRLPIEKILNAEREIRYLPQLLSTYAREGKRSFRLGYWQAVSGESWVRLEPAAAAIETPQDMEAAAELLHMRMIRDSLLRQHDQLQLANSSLAEQQSHQELCQLAGKLSPSKAAWPHGQWVQLRLPELTGMAAEVLAGKADLDLQLNLDYGAVTIRLVDNYLLQTLVQLQYWLSGYPIQLQIHQINQDCYYGLQLMIGGVDKSEMPFWLHTLMDTLVVQLHQGRLSIEQQGRYLMISWLFVAELQPQ